MVSDILVSISEEYILKYNHWNKSNFQNDSNHHKNLFDDLFYFKPIKLQKDPLNSL